MNTTSLSAWAIRAALFVLVVVVGCLPWPGHVSGFNGLFRGGSNLLLERLTFGEVGHASLVPLDARNGGKNGAPARQAVVADTALVLRVDGIQGRLTLGLNLRREAYWPLLLFVATVLAAPTRARSKVRCALLGTPLVLLISFGAIWCLGMCTFALDVRGIYPFGPIAKRAVDLLYRGLLLPPGTRFIAPLVIGLALVVREIRRQPLSPPTPSRIHAASI